MILTAEHLRAFTCYANRVRERAPADLSHAPGDRDQLGEAQVKHLLRNSEVLLTKYGEQQGRDVSHLLDALSLLRRDPAALLHGTLAGATTQNERLRAILLLASEFVNTSITASRTGLGLPRM